MKRSTLFQLIIMLNCCKAVEHYLFSDAPDTGNINLFIFITFAELVDAPSYRHPLDKLGDCSGILFPASGELCFEMTLSRLFAELPEASSGRKYRW